MGAVNTCLLPGGWQLMDAARAGGADMHRTAEVLRAKTEDRGKRERVDAVLGALLVLETELARTQAALTPGPHTIDVTVEGIRPKGEDGQLGYWRVSAALIGW